MQNVNIADAKEYTADHFKAKGIACTVQSADYSAEYGMGAVDVLFTLEDGDYVMTVWYEGDNLYGEW